MTETSAPVTSRLHPGSGKRRKRFQPKGRHASPQALSEVQALLGERPRQRDLLIEFLHLIQDKYGQLSGDHLAALAHEMRLALTEVYEVATFYAHFNVVLDGSPAPRLTIRVCDSLSCEMQGAQDLLKQLPTALGDNIRVVAAPCMGRCHTAPVAEVGHCHIDHASVERICTAVENNDTHPHVPSYQNLTEYQADAGYSSLQQCLSGQFTRQQLIETMLDSSLRGMGGAGFPTGKKWQFVSGYAGPRLMAVNGDEGEPGTFKDRHYLETKPHQFLEGMLIAAWVVEAETVYLYLRDEYPAAREILLAEIAALEQAGLCPHTRIELRRGAGAYICGEESAMIESIEGKRGLPRHRPPYVAEVGIFNRPTLVQNIETLYWIPDIIRRGPASFAEQGRNGGKGMRSFSVSGRVKNPGVKLAPAGITMQQLIDEYCDGMQEGHQFKGYLPGGASGGILPASMADIPLEFGQLEKHGCFVGSHAVVVLSDHDNMQKVALNLMRFFEDESCGQCTPCRVGTEKAVKLMQSPAWDLPLLDDLSQVMRDASICGLGQAASNPLQCVIKYFPEDLS